MNFNKELFYKEFVQREEGLPRVSYNSELEFYYYVMNGDVDTVKRCCEEEPLIEKPGLGILSRNKLQNMKYHFVITTALVARFCIEGGMEHSAAYTISDMYIQKADEALTVAQISELHPAMCIDYATRMRSINKKKILSKYVSHCIDYIYNNLHTKITMNDLSEHVGLNRSYLSKLFSKEMGISITDYIIDKKIDTAKNMLLYSEYNTAEIASILAFSSQSYFNEVFKKKTGITPTKFRNTNLFEIRENRNTSRSK